VNKINFFSLQSCPKDLELQILVLPIARIFSGRGFACFWGGLDAGFRAVIRRKQPDYANVAFYAEDHHVGRGDAATRCSSNGEQSSANSFKPQNRLTVCLSFIFLLNRVDNQ
jgi:hypothetical protein